MARNTVSRQRAAKVKSNPWKFGPLKLKSKTAMRKKLGRTARQRKKLGI